MKTLLFVAIGGVLWSAFGACFASDGSGVSLTNLPAEIKLPSLPITVYLTDDDKSVIVNGAGEAKVSTSALLTALQQPESRPAEQDAEGNWGLAVKGFQLSIRFDTKTFTNGETVLSKVLIRNISDRDLSFPLVRVATVQHYNGLAANFEFAINGPDGKAVKGKPREYNPLPKQWRIAKGTQRRLEIPLSEEFNFQRPGLYKVRVRTLLSNPGADAEHRFVEVRSGEAVIEVQ